MDRIDVLGTNPERAKVFTKELLAEANDVELQDLVEQAAKELNSPIAIVSLVLEKVQFFKAHVGLPPALVSARGTNRDVSFCQFVVRDEKPFEVNDATTDTRIPQHMVGEYGIKAYLGVPIQINDTVVGSLCVIDNKKRSFSEQNYEDLKKLAELVNNRLKIITTVRRRKRLELTEATLQPALDELSQSLEAIEGFINTQHNMDKSIQTYLRHSKYLEISKQIEGSAAIKSALAAAVDANQRNEDLLLEMEMALGDAMDCLQALQQIVSKEKLHAKISDVVIAAQDLSRNACREVGGFTLPDFVDNPLIYTKSNLAIAVVSNCLLYVASIMRTIGSTKGINLAIKASESEVELAFFAQDLMEPQLKAIAQDLRALIGEEEPTVSVTAVHNAVIVKFKTMPLKR